MACTLYLHPWPNSPAWHICGHFRWCLELATAKIFCSKVAQESRNVQFLSRWHVAASTQDIAPLLFQLVTKNGSSPLALCRGTFLGAATPNSCPKLKAHMVHNHPSSPLKPHAKAASGQVLGKRQVFALSVHSHVGAMGLHLRACASLQHLMHGSAPMMMVHCLYF
jgi:hypothetical protein